jgi:hypothetical protein
MMVSLTSANSDLPPQELQNEIVTLRIMKQWDSSAVGRPAQRFLCLKGAAGLPDGIVANTD